MKDTRTKIVVTIGPACSDPKTLSRMIESGMRVARLNFSHGSHDEHARLIKMIRSAEKRSGTLVAILQDLQGPKMRLGDLPDQGIELKKSMTVMLRGGDAPYKKDGPIPVGYSHIDKDVKTGQRLLIDDGTIELKVTQVRKRVVYAKVVVGGTVFSHKGINLPDSSISTLAFTDKDKDDLEFGIKHGVDWVALSFVPDAKTVEHVRGIANQMARSAKCIPPKIMAKLERKQAVEAFDEILEAVDGVMIARGDLGIEIPFEEVPIHQKEWIEAARVAGKPSIVATQMLHSMTEHPRATRAEISDVANAVIDHADAVMLSGETAVGEHPVIAVKTMQTVIEEAEASRFDDVHFVNPHTVEDLETSVAHALYTFSVNRHIETIVCDMNGGLLSEIVNKFRPEIPIYAVCRSSEVGRQQLLRSGCFPVVADVTTALFAQKMEIILRKQKKITSKMRVAYLHVGGGGSVELTLR